MYLEYEEKILLLVVVYCFLGYTTLFAQNLEDTETIVYQPISKNVITGEIKKEVISQSLETESDNIQSTSSNNLLIGISKIKSCYFNVKK